LGAAIDNFAGSEFNKLVNPGDSGVLHSRAVGGFDIAYRLLGTPTTNDATTKWRKKQQLWIYGETVHGVRSAEVDCNDHPAFCGTFVPSTQPVKDLSYLIRNASSLEGFLGLRWEFLQLQPKSKTAPAALYLEGQAGFLAVSHFPGDAVDIHHVGLGAVITKGDYMGSFLEAGFGRNDLFELKRNDRWKVNGQLSRKISEGISLFVEMDVDTDVGYGADSFQTYIGFDFNLGCVKEWFGKDCK
jgi:hypothetical protein